jgi:hypothetical protein
VSGHSWSVTIPCDVATGERVVAAQRPGQAMRLHGLPEQPSLLASSHYNWVDWALARLVRSTGTSGLDHLAKGFDPATGQRLGHGPWVTLIEGDDLGLLVAGTQALLTQSRRDPTILTIATGRRFEPVELRDALHMPALTVEEAIAVYRNRRDVYEGDDLPCLVAFLQAHGALAWHASNDGQALFYGAWLY